MRQASDGGNLGTGGDCTRGNDGSEASVPVAIEQLHRESLLMPSWVR